MRKELLVSAVILLVIGSLGAGYLIGKDDQPVTSSISTIPRCNTTYTPSTVEGTKSNSSFLLFDTNSTAWLCVAIYNNNNGTVGRNNSPPPDAWAAQQGTWSYPSPGLNVTTDPSSFLLPPDSVSWYMLEITPVDKTPTIYMVPLPNVCWGSVFIAVGYSTTQIQKTIVDLPSVASSCPAANGLAAVQGFTNLIPTYSK